MGLVLSRHREQYLGQCGPSGGVPCLGSKGDGAVGPGEPCARYRVVPGQGPPEGPCCGGCTHDPDDVDLAEDPFSALPPRELVVKPSISAGGRSTARYTPGDPAAIGHVRKLQQAGQTVMVQEYLARIDEEGEVNLVFLDGSFSHAVAKKPLLHVGDGLVERPWERMAWAGLVEPSANQLAVAHLTMKVAEEQVGCVPVYGRVDLVSGNAGEPLVLEVELIDPYLSFDMQPSAAARLAKALLR